MIFIHRALETHKLKVFCQMEFQYALKSLTSMMGWISSSVLKMKRPKNCKRRTVTKNISGLKAIIH